MESQLNASWKLGSALQCYFWWLACTCEETCESVWPPNASLYASWTCVHLRLPASLYWRIVYIFQSEVILDMAKITLNAMTERWFCYCCRWACSHSSQQYVWSCRWLVQFWQEMLEGCWSHLLCVKKTSLDRRASAVTRLWHVGRMWVW